MLGVDIVNIPEFSKQITSGGETFLNKTFLPNELEDRNPEHLAGIFAAKEAVMKTLNLPAGSWQQIEIINSPRPRASVGGGQKVEISISHHVDYAVAIALELS